jgi:uncharacterized membrane protein
MPSAIPITPDVIVAATALAGLIFVYLGAAVTGFDGYAKSEQHAARTRYQRRVWLSSVGFVLSLVSVFAALLAEWFELSYLAVVSIACLFVAFMVVLLIVVITVKAVS